MCMYVCAPVYVQHIHPAFYRNQIRSDLDDPKLDLHYPRKEEEEGADQDREAVEDLEAEVVALLGGEDGAGEGRAGEGAEGGDEEQDAAARADLAQVADLRDHGRRQRDEAARREAVDGAEGERRARRRPRDPERERHDAREPRHQDDRVEAPRAVREDAGEDAARDAGALYRMLAFLVLTRNVARATGVARGGPFA